jgi:oligopeptide transport system substrate-binding protein
MKRWLRTVPALALIGLVSLILACGSDSDSTPVPQATASSQIAATLGSATPSAGVGGVFRRLWNEPPTLDPHQVGDVDSAGVLVEIFSGLVTLSTDLQVEPDLAERWEVSDDGLVYTFFLRSNAKFHDGKPVTAEDVRYSLERALDPDTYSPQVETYLDDIVGAAEKLKGTAQEISGLRVINDLTIEITIDAPKAYFLAKLTYPTAFVVDRENIEKEGDDWTRKPNGTGPFILASYKIGQEIILERNPHFYRGPALLDRVELILSGGSAMAMYENGEIDITGVGLADLDRVSNPQEALNRELVVAPPGFSLSYIGFNVEQAPFDDPKFRQALALSINKTLIADQVLANLVVPATGILPPDFPGFDPIVQGPSYDAERAVSLLAESAYANNVPRIIITVPGTGGSVGLDLEVILEMWHTTLGIDVEIQQVEWATFLQDLNDKRLQAFAGLGWQADYPDPQDFLDILFHSESRLNHSAYANSTVDRLLEQARVAAEWEDRKALYNQAEQLILDDVPWIPLWFSGENVILLKPYVQGYKVTPLIVPKLKYVWISEG